jgi:hypothetical protein
MADEQQRTDATDELDEGGEQQQQERQQQEEGGGQQQKKPEQSDEMRSAIADLAKTVGDLAKPREEKKELSQDEINELWAVYDPKKTKADFMKKFFRMNDDVTPEQVQEAEALFYDLRDGIVKQSVTGSRHFLTIELDKLSKKLEPVLEHYEKQKTEDLRKRFFETYESLADPKYKKVIDAQAKLIGDKEFENEEAYFKALAEGAAEAIKALVPDFDLGQKPKPKPAATTQKLPRTTVGGGSGSGGGGATRQTSSKTGGDIDTLT